MPPRRRSQKAPRHRTKPDSFVKLIGGRVRKLRGEKDWSFDAFVEETGLGRGYISELERGLVVPTVTSLAKLAKALEVTVADLVLGDSPRERLFDVARHLADRDVTAILKQAEKLLGDRPPT
jgi:transcriptional regulator with XRE-family HTH domain